MDEKLLTEQVKKIEQRIAIPTAANVVAITSFEKTKRNKPDRAYPGCIQN